MFEDKLMYRGEEGKSGEKWDRVWVGRVDFDYRWNKFFERRDVLTLANVLKRQMSAILAIHMSYMGESVVLGIKNNTIDQITEESCQC